jgi:hypothetical protein
MTIGQTFAATSRASRVTLGMARCSAVAVIGGVGQPPEIGDYAVRRVATPEVTGKGRPADVECGIHNLPRGQAASRGPHFLLRVASVSPGC